MVRSGPVSRRSRTIAALVVLVGGVLVCPAGGLAWARAPRSAVGPAPIVIVISLDGTHPDMLQRAELPTLEGLTRTGARAEALVPVLPTNTFPNHVSMATGVSPARHGIVNNVFEDPERGRFRYDDDPTWLEAEPIWAIAERHGIRTAIFHWVGSEGAWRNGVAPSDWVRFDGSTPEADKVDRLLEWLSRAPGERPRLLMSWFHGADSVAHRQGPAAPAVRAALEAQDAELARLVAGVERLGLADRTILLVVSDHGMERVRRTVDLARAFERAGIRARVLGGGGFVTVRLERTDEDLDRAEAIVVERGLEVWRPLEAPPELGLRHRRFGDLAVMAPPGTAIVRGEPGLLERMARVLAPGLVRIGGAHGHRPEEPSMAGIFIASGPGVAPGRTLGRVHVLDVAPTVIEWLGIAVPSHVEGRSLAPRLAPDPSRSEP